MRTLLKLLLGLTLTSCTLFVEDGDEVEIVNNSDHPIHNVKFYTTEKLTILTYDTIKVNQKVEEFLSIKKNKTDGSYVFEYTRVGGEKVASGGGYYTNGAEIERRVSIEVSNDTTKINFIGSRYDHY